MADMLNVGLSGLMANQTALDVTSQNISNVNTPGYSAQTALMATQQPQSTANGWIGAGVTVQTIRRQYDNLLTQQVRSSSSSVGRLTTFSGIASQVSSMFSDGKTGVSVALSNFSNAVQNVATDPTSTAARTALLGQAKSFVNQLQSYTTQLNQDSTGVNQQIGTEVSTINTLASGIARLNGQINDAQGMSGQPPNDLLDQRDTLLNQLAGHVSISTTTQDNGTVNVVMGNGQSLIVGTQATTLKAMPNPADASQQIIAAQTPSGPVDVTANVTGGTLGGLLDLRGQVIEPAIDALGAIADQVAQLANQQNSVGLDLKGALGTSLFSVGAPTVRANILNTGTETVAATVADATALTGTNYTLSYTGGVWSMKRLDTGAAVALSGAGTAANPLMGDGLSIVVSGAAPAAGDSFEIQPTRNAVGGMSVLITDPNKIAAAGALKTAAVAANTGSGSISSASVLTPGNAQLLTGTTIRFLTPATYSVNGAGSFAYTAGGNIAANGWQVQISGAPATGDQFTVASNAGATGDNSNALKLAGILQTPVLSGGTQSLTDSASQLVTGLGIQANQAQNNLSAETVVNNDATAALSNATGVNLDQEAANMLRYQQAYAACAQIIKTASAMFNTLMSAVQGA